MNEPICSFCLSERKNVDKLWSNAREFMPMGSSVVYICNLCIDAAYRAQHESGSSSEDVPPPTLPG